MPDWLIVYLGSLQAGVMRGLAAELRAGGIGTVALAFTLGAAHALTPGHGKTALAAYFLEKEAKIGKGLRVALAAAFLHVLSWLRSVPRASPPDRSGRLRSPVGPRRHSP